MAGAIHQIHDTDNHFILDPITRAVKNETVKKLSLVIGDHNSEIFTFELPRYVEGHDMAKCNKVEVHYVNTQSTTKEKSAERYKVVDFAVDPADNQKVIFSWTLSEKATKYAGSLAFAIHFACIDEITEEVHYWWSTATNNTITVLDCIDLTPEETEEKTDLQEKTATPTKDTQVVRPDGEFRGLSRVVVEPIPEEYIIPTGTLFVDANGDYEVREFDKIMVNVPDVPAVLQEKEITANGTHTPDTGYEGFSQVTVNVADVPAVLQEKTAHPSTSEQTIEPDSGYDGLSKVTVGPMHLQSKTVEQNGEVIADSGYHGLQKVTVRVKPQLQTKRLDIAANGETEVIADSGYYGLDKVSVRVNVATEPVKLQSKVITQNGTFEPDEGYDGMDKVYVSVPGEAAEAKLQEKTATPSESAQSITPDSGYDGLSKVTVSAVQTEEQAVTPTTEEQAVTPTKGKYLKSVTVGAVQTEVKTAYPKATSQKVTPDDGKFLSEVNVAGVQVDQCPTITPNKETQTFTPTADHFYEHVTVNPIPDDYVVPEGDLPVTENGTFDCSGKSTVTVEVAGAEAEPFSTTNTKGLCMFIMSSRYPFEEGMTWADFVASDYNPLYSNTTSKFFRISDSKVYVQSENYPLRLMSGSYDTLTDDSIVNSTDTIVNLGQYHTRNPNY